MDGCREEKRREKKRKEHPHPIPSHPLDQPAKFPAIFVYVDTHWRGIAAILTRPCLLFVLLLVRVPLIAADLPPMSRTRRADIAESYAAGRTAFRAWGALLGVTRSC